jgi:hypothetical protein
MTASEEEVPHSQFRQDLDAGAIGEVTVEPERIVYTLSESGEEADETVATRKAVRIVVKGWLSDSAVERLGDMKIASVEGEGRETVTALVGPVRDQAALNGILNSLRGLHLTVLTVEVRNKEEKVR